MRGIQVHFGKDVGQMKCDNLEILWAFRWVWFWMVLLMFLLFVVWHARRTRNGYIYYFPKNVLFFLAMRVGRLILRASMEIPGGWETIAHDRPIVKRGQLSIIFEYCSLGKQQPHTETRSEWWVILMGRVDSGEQVGERLPYIYIQIILYLATSAVHIAKLYYSAL